VLATSEKYASAALVIDPYFYKGQRSQILARVAVINEKGRRVRQIVRVRAADGTGTVTSCDKPRERIVPKFDGLEPEPKVPEKKGKS